MQKVFVIVAILLLAAAETLKTLEGTPVLAPGTYAGSRCGFRYWDADTLPDFLLSAYDGTVALYRGAELTGNEAGQTPAVFRLVLSPNPAGRSVTVCLPAAIPLSASPAIKVLDVQGRLVLSRLADASTVVLDVSTLPAGVYICRFQAGRYTASQRLVVSR